MIPAARPSSEGHVLNAGCLLLKAMVFSLGLRGSRDFWLEHHERKKSATEGGARRDYLGTGIGQRCVEGVRRLEHSSGKALLRAVNRPSESGTRLLLRDYIEEVSGSDAHLKMTQFYLERARLEQYAPAVFYTDSHMRPYTGKRKLQKGWRMRDKRVRSGTCDYLRAR